MKAQLELNMSTAENDNKKYFYKHTNSKKRAKENLHPLYNVKRNIVTKNEGKNKVLSDFSASVFNNQTPCSPGTQQLEMEYREGKQNETPHNPKGNDL